MKKATCKITELVEVPEFKSFYSAQSTLELENSIKEIGLKSPIIIDKNHAICDGYRRLEVFRNLGYDNIPVFILENEATLEERIVRNLTRIKTGQDHVNEMREVFKKYPKKQGKRNNDSSQYVRHEKVSDALGGKWKGDIMINKLENILFNDVEGDVLSRGIVEKNWKVEPCYEFITRWMEIDLKNCYGYTDQLKNGIYNINEVNKFIEEKYKVDNKFNYSFFVPNKITVVNDDAININKILNSKETLDLVVTSVPYWDLRNYKQGGDRQLGHEKTKEEYVENIAKIFKALETVLKETGNIIINIGETYVDGQGQGIPFLLRDAILEHTQFKYKDTLIWSKKNSRPQGENVKRPQNSIEYLLWFVKNPKESKYNQLTYSGKVREVKVVSGAKNVGKDGKVGTKSKYVSKPYKKLVSHLKEQELENIITTSIGKDHELYNIISTGHPAPMSPMLPVTLILMLSDEGDTICDIFGGSQVTGKISTLLNRRYISTEISKEYFNIGCERLSKAINDFDRESLDFINDIVQDNDVSKISFDFIEFNLRSIEELYSINVNNQSKKAA